MYQLAYDLGMRIFELSKTFPADERYSLTSQIRRASRSVAVNIAEAYRKRQYPKSFVAKLSDADGKAIEIQVHLDFARDCGYLQESVHEEVTASYEEVGRMLGAMIRRPDKFGP
ncbi:MAG: four helix bundle protein [Planctomycetaceae bacterium]